MRARSAETPSSTRIPGGASTPDPSAGPSCTGSAGTGPTSTLREILGDAAAAAGTSRSPFVGARSAAERSGLPPRPLILGEAPSPGAVLGRGHALQGRPSGVLLRCYVLAGGSGPEDQSDAWLVQRFRTVNLFERRPPVWRVTEARHAASIVSRREIDTVHGDRVILLGRRVVEAMGFPGRPWFDSWDDGRVRFWLTPHPSGLSRIMNDPDVQRRVGDTLREALLYPGPTATRSESE